MDIFIKILLGVGILLTAGASFYLAIKKKIEEEAIDAINFAEDSDKKAQEKMEEAIEYIYINIPSMAKVFISKETIRTIVQKALDKIEDYVRKQKGTKKNGK